VCLSLPSIRGIKGTNGAPTHIVAHTSVIAGLPTLVSPVQSVEPVGQRNSRSSAPCHQRIGVSDTRPGLKEHLVPTTVRRASNGLQTWKQDAEQSICGARADKPKPTRQRRSG